MDRFMNFFNQFESFFNDFEKFNGLNLNEMGLDENGEWVKKTFSSDDGSIKLVSFTRVANTKQNYRVEDLKKQMEVFVENQEFEKAAELRDLIKSIECNKEKKVDLEKELELAVKSQNFEKAIWIRDQLKKMN
jgi:excinuclease UvrABC nuclease subunit